MTKRARWCRYLPNHAAIHFCIYLHWSTQTDDDRAIYSFVSFSLELLYNILSPAHSSCAFYFFFLFCIWWCRRGDLMRLCRRVNFFVLLLMLSNMRNLRSGGLCVYTDLYWKDARWSLKRSTPPGKNKKNCSSTFREYCGHANAKRCWTKHLLYSIQMLFMFMHSLCAHRSYLLCAIPKVHIHIWHPSRMVKNEIQYWPRHTPVTRMLAYLNITSVRHRLYQIAGEKWQPALSTASTHRFIHPRWGVHRSMSMPIVNRQPPKINITHKRIEKK